MERPDVIAESLRILREGLPDEPVRLSRRRRFAPLSTDVDGNVAATAFVSRPKRGRPDLDIWMNTWTFELADGVWQPAGGGGGSGAVIGPRPSVSEMGGRYLFCSGSGKSRRRHHRWQPWIGQAVVRAAAEVEELRVGRRRLPVRVHGYHVIVWSSRRAPRLEAWASERRLEVLDLRDPHGLGR